ncbi:MAG: potassium channel family protein [Planctomycetota bacterium]
MSDDRFIAVWTSRMQTHVGLFLWLSSIFLVFPHLRDAEASRMLLDIFFTLAIVFALCRWEGRRRTTSILYFITGVTAAVSAWIAYGTGSGETIVSGLYALFFGFSVYIHFCDLVAVDEVDGDTLLGAACAYMLIGLFFASLFMLFYSIDPACMSLSSEKNESSTRLVYFSFITLTTVGYGDVVPTSSVTRMLAAYEAIIGQAFMAIIVGLLVGKRLSRMRPE